RNTSSSAPWLSYATAASTGSPASRRFTNWTPLTTRPSFTSRQGITRLASMLSPEVGSAPLPALVARPRLAPRCLPPGIDCAGKAGARTGHLKGGGEVDGAGVEGAADDGAFDAGDRGEADEVIDGGHAAGGEDRHVDGAGERGRVVDVGALFHAVP